MELYEVSGRPRGQGNPAILAARRAAVEGTGVSGGIDAEEVDTAQEQALPTATTVVTPARFAEGLSYADFLAQATVNRDKFDESYQSVPLTDDDISFFRKVAALPHGPAKILALAEAWCGDVYRELPTAVRIAEATGMELRVFFGTKIPTSWTSFSATTGIARHSVFVFLYGGSPVHHALHRALGQCACRACGGKGGSDSPAQPSRDRDVRESSGWRETDVPAGGDREKIRPWSDQWRMDAIKEIRELSSTALKVPNAGSSPAHCLHDPRV